MPIFDEQLVVLVDPWQDKYERLFEAHEKLQNLNQCLEEKLLKISEEDQDKICALSGQAAELTQRLVEARLYIHQLEDENERYRNDINVVVQLLQCKPSNFISPKIETLPEDLQRKVLGQRNGSGRKEKKIIKVQVPTYPSADIMYAVDKGRGRRNGEKDSIVSAAIMARVLQEREKERKENQRNRCNCASRISLPTFEKETQTLPSCTISYPEFDELLFHTGRESLREQQQIQHQPSRVTDIDEDSLPAPLIPTTIAPRRIFKETSFIHHHLANAPPTTTTTTTSRKLAGQCVRMLDEAELGSHWTATVLVSHPPRKFEVLEDEEDDVLLPLILPPEELRQDLGLHQVEQHQQHQICSQFDPGAFYRAQKRTFWTRSSSTTSTETEI